MSEIPYQFKAIPEEFLHDEFLEDIHMMRLIRYMFKRLRHYEHDEHMYVNRHHYKIKLMPFEWIYGRDMAAKECKTTPDIVRARITQLLSLGFIERSPSSSTSSFSVYRLVSTSFSKNNTQQFPQQNPQQFPQQFPHKEESKIVDKEAACAKDAAAGFASQVEEIIQGVKEDKLPIEERSLRRLLKKHGIPLVAAELDKFSREKHRKGQDKTAIFTCLCNEATLEKQNLRE